MGNNNFVWEYVQSCTAGSWGASDCRPVWEFGAIGTLLVLAVATFLILIVVRLQEESRLTSH